MAKYPHITVHEESFTIEDGKRFRMPVTITDICPKCKVELDFDLDDHYLSYPTANKLSKFSCYHHECGEEWVIPIKLLVSLEIPRTQHISKQDAVTKGIYAISFDPESYEDLLNEGKAVFLTEKSEFGEMLTTRII